MLRRLTDRSTGQEDKRRLILDAAVRVFARKGYHTSRVGDIAEEAGVAHGLLYHYFRSKEELLEAVLDQHYFLPELRRIASSDRDRPVAEVLLELTLGCWTRIARSCS